MEDEMWRRERNGRGEENTSIAIILLVDCEYQLTGTR